MQGSRCGHQASPCTLRPGRGRSRSTLFFLEATTQSGAHVAKVQVLALSEKPHVANVKSCCQAPPHADVHTSSNRQAEIDLGVLEQSSGKVGGREDGDASCTVLARKNDGPGKEAVPFCDLRRPAASCDVRPEPVRDGKLGSYLTEECELYRSKTTRLLSERPFLFVRPFQQALVAGRMENKQEGIARLQKSSRASYRGNDVKVPGSMATPPS